VTETKELLRAAIGATQPAIPDVRSVLQRRRARRRRERVVAAVVALALTAGLAIGLGTLLHGDGGARPSDGVRVVGPTLVVLIPSVSMEPTLRVGDSVLVDEGAYRASAGLPERGDLIAFITPARGDTPYGALGQTFVKRVVGLPGDTVEERSGAMYVDGKPFLMPPATEPDHRAMGPWTVQPGHVFVVGDNLGNSNDSRYALGQLPITNIVGKVVEILSPNDRRATIEPPPAGSVAGPGPTGPSGR
jgi:signal peptidase I